MFPGKTWVSGLAGGISKTRRKIAKKAGFLQKSVKDTENTRKFAKSRSNEESLPPSADGCWLLYPLLQYEPRLSGSGWSP
jgi:hypothetical protein